MKIGVNWTSPRDTEYIKETINSDKCDYVEILIDNFFSLDPNEVKCFLGETPVSFHIMSSMFLTKNDAFLTDMAKNINYWIKVLNPIYISDHFGFFEYQGNLLPMVAEVDYAKDVDILLSKTALWQNKLNMPLLIENYPSYTDLGLNQIQFYKQLKLKLNIDVLFDISNAIVAEKNIGVKASEWKALVKDSNHFHCGGYRNIDLNGNKNIEKPLVLDSHDTQISAETVLYAKEILGNFDSDTTITIERDSGKEYSSWKSDEEVLSANLL